MKLRFLPRMLSAALALIFIARLQAWAGDEFGAAEPFKSGDTVCYVGDSITHGGTYHMVVDLYYATRFPDRPLQTWNCGIGGDRASTIMSDEKFRLNTDILDLHPTVATIMLGMNDVGRTDYGADKTGPEVEQRRRASFETYNANMKKLIEALEKSGARVTLITPSIYDETTKLANANPDVGVGRNGALTICAHTMEDWAKEYHTGLVRFNEVMNTITTREQAKDPAFTLVGPDRVHPGAVGHFVMAYTFLRAQGLPSEVARIAVDARRAAPAGPSRCDIERVKATATGVEFDCLEKALPFVPAQEAKPALALVPFQQDLNQEILKIDGVAEGRYALAIDGQKAGEYLAAELAAGVNLAENPRTPQYKQSAIATKLAYDRVHAGVALRNVNAQYYTLSRARLDIHDRPAVEKKLTAMIDEAKAKGVRYDAAAEALLKNPDEQAALLSALETATTAFVKACQPQPHHFTLTRL